MANSNDFTKGEITLDNGKVVEWKAVGYGSLKDKDDWTWKPPSESVLRQNIANPDFHTLIDIDDGDYTFSLTGGYIPEDFVDAVEWYVARYGGADSA